MRRLALQGAFSPRSASGRRWRADYQVFSATEAIVLSYLFRVSFLPVHGPQRRRRVQTTASGHQTLAIAEQPPSAVNSKMTDENDENVIEVRQDAQDLIMPSGSKSVKYRLDQS